MGATTVSGTILGVDNAPRVGVYVYFRLKTTGTDSVATSTIDATRISAVTDASGQFSTTLWDNGDSGVTSIMEIQMPSGQRHDVIIPAGDAAIDIWDLIETYTVGTADPQLPTNQALFMRKANNLSDVVSASTSRTNLGVAIGSDVQAHSAILDATTASFTIADETKLDGIEALADVTDAANVAAAGGYIVGGTDVAIADGGTGASTASAARTNLGFASNAAPSTTTITATTYTALVTDSVILADDDTAAAIVTITLLAAATAGSGFIISIKKIGNTANVIIDGNASETIDGGLTATLSAQYESITLTTNGTNWYVI